MPPLDATNASATVTVGAERATPAVNARQTVLLSLDVYRLLGEILPDERGVIVDGGANVGEASKALRRHFPHAAIHAFEPVGEAWDDLDAVARAIDVHAHQLALGDADGAATINVNRNLWTCSLLEANERGHAFHDDWCETVRRETITVRRLDTWAREHEVDEIAILKLDLQGYELAALRGAGDLLPSVKAVYAEAQITPEYRGAATFADIDTWLRERGFRLYQLADLCLKGHHAEPSCCDGLWLRADVFAHVRAQTAPGAIDAARDVRNLRMAEALTRCADAGLTRIALYGAGAHSVACAAAMAAPPVEIVAFLDDARAGGRLWGIPIDDRAGVERRAVDAVVISSDRAEDAIFARCSDLLARGMTVVTLYQNGRVQLHHADGT